MSTVPDPIAIVYIHGTAVEAPGYSHVLHAAVQRHLRRHGCEAPVAAHEVFWGDLFAESFERLRTLMSTLNLSWPCVRHMTLDTVAQALGYDDAPGYGAYEEVHERVSAALQAAQVPGAPVRLFLVAHSLGTLVASNYIWDAQHARGDAGAEVLDSCQGLVTMGSPLALACCRYVGFGAPIQAASRGIIWLNLVAAADPLAWPLRGLNTGYASEVTQDVILRPRWWQFKQRTPIAHTGYWDSQVIADTIGGMILSAIRPKEIQ